MTPEQVAAIREQNKTSAPMRFQVDALLDDLEKAEQALGLANDYAFHLEEKVARLAADYDGAVGKFDATRGALCDLLKLSGRTTIPPDDWDGKWHEWLIAEVDALRGERG